MVVLPKSVSESRIVENLKATEILLSPDDIEKLKSIDKNCRFFTMQIMTAGKTLSEIWDTEQDEAYIL